MMRRENALQVLIDVIAEPGPAESHQQTLMLLGNLCSDAVDANSRITKRALLRAGADRTIFSQLALAEKGDALTLMFCCGLIQNLSLDRSWAECVLQRGVDKLLDSLVHHPDENVVSILPFCEKCQPRSSSINPACMYMYVYVHVHIAHVVCTT